MANANDNAKIVSTATESVSIQVPAWIDIEKGGDRARLNIGAYPLNIWLMAMGAILGAKGYDRITGAESRGQPVSFRAATWKAFDEQMQAGIWAAKGEATLMASLLPLDEYIAWQADVSARAGFAAFDGEITHDGVRYREAVESEREAFTAFFLNDPGFRAKMEAKWHEARKPKEATPSKPQGALALLDAVAKKTKPTRK